MPALAARLGVPRLSPRRGLALPGAWLARALCAQANPDGWCPAEDDPATRPPRSRCAPAAPSAPSAWPTPWQPVSGTASGAG